MYRSAQPVDRFSEQHQDASGALVARGYRPETTGLLSRPQPTSEGGLMQARRVPRVRITTRAVLGRRAAAVLDQEMRQLARQLGLQVSAIRIRRIAPEA